MIQGAGSNVGKSMLVAGIARACVKRGMSVAPFKPQNMSNNAAVTADGGEIGRAQALQAMACGLDPLVDMNPVLLKPESEIGAQVIVQGKRFATMKARDYGKQKSKLMPPVLDSFRRIGKDRDLVIVEGAGSPAEVNLRAGDIANMGFASAANVPVVLVGDIDRGGVIAQLVGTHAVLPPEDEALIKGFAINKFRGDTTLFAEGMDIIAARTDWTPLGIIPWFADAWKLPAEDVMDIASRKGGAIKIAVPRLNRIANFDDLDPLTATADVTVEIIEAGRPLPGDADLVIIPGSKSTIADLAHFRAQGWDVDLAAHVRRGGHVLGVCGGYQMLGTEIIDDDGIEGAPARVPGLGLLNVRTVMVPHKRLALSEATYLATGDRVSGYEIHIGMTEGPDCNRAWLSLHGRNEGATSADGKVMGCYLHGLFAADAFRAAFLASIGKPVTAHDYTQSIEDTLDALADHLEAHMDIHQLLTLAG
ncbi:adenosylcobyric acid synthase (glutamine-hydrolysing) [Yoonia maricola]|uniref:Cobyric acid synthase n=2 Tax=Yoonia maricola TaxID=420999 RepID=A0A2M8WP43_9RHOB|nr:adenosylcobyric acid synthase (glutamine-hydrolysing) [Yoonia maricola]